MSFLVTPDGFFKVYTDGSYDSNRNIGGIGVWFNEGHILNHSSKVNVHDNNTCEMMAVNKAVELIDKHLVEQPVAILTNSQYVMRHIDQYPTVRNPNIMIHFAKDDPQISEAHKLAYNAASS